MSSSISIQRFFSSAAVLAMLLFAFQVNVSGSRTVLVTPVTAQTAEFSFTYCNVFTSAYEIPTGAAVTISWETAGFATYTLNGEVVAGPAGSKTFENVRENTTYTLVATTADGKSTCTNAVTVTCLPVPPPTCTLEPLAATIVSGGSITLSWTTTNATSATLSLVGAVALEGTQSTGPLTTNTTYTLTVQGTDGSTIDCLSTITVTTPVPPPTCTLTPITETISSGQSVNLVWTTANASTTQLTDFGVVALEGTQNTGPLTANKTYTLTVLGIDGSTITCPSVITVVDTPPPAPTCVDFTATPSTVNQGGTTTLAWTTANAARVVINNGIGQVGATGTLAVSPLATTLYTLIVYNAADVATDDCTVTVTVTEVPLVPVCDLFTASPETLSVGGGSTVLTWGTRNGTSVTISPTIGAVGATGSSTVSVSTTTTFTLVVTGTGGQSDSCTRTVTVPPPQPVPFTCANNVSFSASPTRITRGAGSVLSWSTVGVTAVRFDQGITATSLSGALTVEPRDTTTYTLTATQNGTTISCPVTVTVTSGGGGGGSVSPTCELSVSRNTIARGDVVTLRWDTNRATEVEIVDSKKQVMMTTKDKLAADKDEYFDGSIRVSPTSDTTYTLTASRGSRERVCTVNVKVEDTVFVTQVRDQKPLVSGIALIDVPYTGFEAGPIMTLSFYALLLAWALYIAYLIVIKRDGFGGFTLAGNHIVADAPTPEEIRPDVFVSTVRPSTVATAAPYTPENLPTAAPTIVGYATSPEAKQVEPATTFIVTDEVVTALENHAHTKKSLLSSDAIRHLVGSTKSLDESISVLNEVITESKAKYPSEDGWVVINERRMRELCDVCQARPVPSSTAPFVPTVIPEGSGSLAEAIVTGNIVAAYEMIGHRPMFALADAAADMDSVLRHRRGGTEVISDLLLATTKSLTDEQVMKIIEALTGALDGTYTDEASAVKMAIMKAVKVVA